MIHPIFRWFFFVLECVYDLLFSSWYESGIFSQCDAEIFWRVQQRRRPRFVGFFSFFCQTHFIRRRFSNDRRPTFFPPTAAFSSAFEPKAVFFRKSRSAKVTFEEIFYLVNFYFLQKIENGMRKQFRRSNTWGGRPQLDGNYFYPDRDTSSLHP